MSLPLDWLRNKLLDSRGRLTKYIHWWDITIHIIKISSFWQKRPWEVDWRQLRQTRVLFSRYAYRRFLRNLDVRENLSARKHNRLCLGKVFIKPRVSKIKKQERKRKEQGCSYVEMLTRASLGLHIWWYFLIAPIVPSIIIQRWSDWLKHL